MATAPAPTPVIPTRMSFAKVAASGAKDNRVPRVAVPTMDHRRAPPTNVTSAPKNGNSTSKNLSPTATDKTPIQAPCSARTTSQSGPTLPTDDKMAQKLRDLSLSSGPPTPSLVVNGSSASINGLQSKNENGNHLSDDASQRADSSSDVGTKAPSLDGKSITSGTTFALDEKESLRPDDSASVKAAAEDDESFSVRGSQMTNSRMGSEVARIHRLRIGDMPERRIIQLLPESHDQGLATPQSGDSGVPPPTDASQTLGTVAGTPDAFSTMYSQNPDDKLLEAMASPKDRIFLLRLEQDVINFVQSSEKPFMDLPPSNSFCRMLTHKLADYYHMTHSFEAVQGAVRIYRTPFCRVPPSLASIAGSKEPESNTNAAPPVLLPKKIMRRGEEGGSGPASTSPSKATSEVGSDGKEKSNSKEKLTREQREEAYNKARERIFGASEKTGESTPENEDANGTSRASSVSGKEKSNLGKRGKTGKQRRDDSESFDSRSQYTAWYGGHHYVGPQPAGGWQPQYAGSANGQFGGQIQQPYPHAMQQPYPAAPQNYPQMMQQGQANGYPQYNPMPSYPQQPSQPVPQRYPPAGGPVPSYGSPIPSAQPPQPWSQPGYAQSPPPAPTPYQQQPSRPSQPTNQHGIPYAFGQLPVNVNPNDPKSQHPIPGSYNRHAFNPKTQSFVPGTGMGPAQPQPPMPYHMGGPHGSPQVGSPHLAYPAYAHNGPPQPYMGGPSYGMSRQSSNNSLPAYHHQGTPPQHLPQHPGTHLPQMPQLGSQIPHQITHPLPNKGPQPMNNTHPHFTSLPNYGNPATLPQKPPTGM
ncbi:hypothetical protein BKA67DRAFT_675766 [Truncatella angustata]|uniref:R3H domain-containing protein n=1 Tax=Truncatella angustata TaxID=152316 RepID=A0A9P8UPE5_9PEZI|nr:uncharacterized protein BKA67DRAFT_675766 [Truncatella angustata]KAH6655775.1 hypothetical protein BKA67DRAFT_675766 [Truncatella angustata]